MALFKRDKNRQPKSKKEQEFLKAKRKVEKTFSFTKIAILFILISSEFQIWGSYFLAYLGKEAIAEALSQQIVITIIGTMIAYFVKSVIENLSKYTTLFGQNLDIIIDEDKKQSPDELVINDDFSDGCTVQDTNIPNM